MQRIDLDVIISLSRLGRLNWRIAGAFQEAREGNHKAAAEFLREFFSPLKYLGI